MLTAHKIQKVKDAASPLHRPVCWSDNKQFLLVMAEGCSAIKAIGYVCNVRSVSKTEPHDLVVYQYRSGDMWLSLPSSGFEGFLTMLGDESLHATIHRAVESQQAIHVLAGYGGLGTKLSELMEARFAPLPAEWLCAFDQVRRNGPCIL